MENFILGDLINYEENWFNPEPDPISEPDPTSDLDPTSEPDPAKTIGKNIGEVGHCGNICSAATGYEHNRFDCGWTH